MAGKDKLQKKLPDRASKSHPKHAKRMGHKARAAVKHSNNRIRQDQNEKVNDELRAQGLPTPWKLAKANRYAARH